MNNTKFYLSSIFFCFILGMITFVYSLNDSFADKSMYMLFETELKGNWKFISPLTGNYYENLGLLKIISIDHESGRILGELNTVKTGKVHIYGCLSEGGGTLFFSESIYSCVSVDKTSSKNNKPQVGGIMNDTNSGAFSIMKDLDSRARIDTSIAQKNEDYLFKGFVFYKACKAMDAAFFGGQLIVNLPCKPDIVGYIYTSSGEDYGWKAFR